MDSKCLIFSTDCESSVDTDHLRELLKNPSPPSVAPERVPTPVPFSWIPPKQAHFQHVKPIPVEYKPDHIHSFYDSCDESVFQPPTWRDKVKHFCLQNPEILLYAAIMVIFIVMLVRDVNKDKKQQDYNRLYNEVSDALHEQAQREKLEKQREEMRYQHLLASLSEDLNR